MRAGRRRLRRAEGLPLSAVHLDIDYMDGYRVFTVDPARFPDLAGLAADLARPGHPGGDHRRPGGARSTPATTSTARAGDDGRFVHRRPRAAGRRGGVARAGRLPRLHRPRRPGRGGPAQYRRLHRRRGGRDLARHERAHLDRPAGATAPCPLSTRHDVDGRGGDHAEGHNVYGLLMNRAGYEGLRRRRARTGDRSSLSRSGWAGLQRWAWNWTGDVESSWDGLRQQVATVVGLGLSGVPYTGSDIGGFSGVPDPELYLRWLEMTVLHAVLPDPHRRWAPAREPWRFPEPYRRPSAGWSGSATASCPTSTPWPTRPAGPAIRWSARWLAGARGPLATAVGGRRRLPAGRRPAGGPGDQAGGAAGAVSRCRPGDGIAGGPCPAWALEPRSGDGVTTGGGRSAGPARRAPRPAGGAGPGGARAPARRRWATRTGRAPDGSGSPGPRAAPAGSTASPIRRRPGGRAAATTTPATATARAGSTGSGCSGPADRCSLGPRRRTAPSGDGGSRSARGAGCRVVVRPGHGQAATRVEYRALRQLAVRAVAAPAGQVTSRRKVVK